LDTLVPAAIIAGLFYSDLKWDGKLEGKYFILDDERPSSAISLDESEQEKIWKRVCEDIGLSEGI
jgi:hypothetical protein